MVGTSHDWGIHNQPLPKYLFTFMNKPNQNDGFQAAKVAVGKAVTSHGQNNFHHLS